MRVLLMQAECTLMTAWKGPRDNVQDQAQMCRQHIEGNVAKSWAKATQA